MNAIAVMCQQLPTIKQRQRSSRDACATSSFCHVRKIKVGLSHGLSWMLLHVHDAQSVLKISILPRNVRWFICVQYLLFLLLDFIPLMNECLNQQWEVFFNHFYTTFFDHSCLEAIKTASLISVGDRQLAPCGGRCCLYSTEVRGQQLKGSGLSHCCCCSQVQSKAQRKFA